MIQIRKMLLPHPKNQLKDLSISVTIEGSWERLNVLYQLNDPRQIALWPAPKEERRSQTLWTSTCFEIFARVKDHNDYSEWNLSPDQCWGFFDHSGPRVQRLSNTLSGLSAAPHSEGHESLKSVAAQINLAQALPALPLGATAQVGLSAVIATDQGLEYFALAHRNAQTPDFHQFASWVLLLP